MDTATDNAIVIGGTGGIGAQIAADLRAEGIRVAALSRTSLGEVERFADLHVPCDVTDAEQVQRAVDTVVRQFGAPAMLIHSAGKSFGGGVADTPVEHWRAGIELLLGSVFYTCKAVLPVMAQAGGGAALIISSAAGHRPVGDAITYATAKGALSHMVTCIAKEFASRKIRVNALAPGFVDTGFHDSASPEHLHHTAAKRIPAGRFATPGDVSHMALSLLRNPYVNGQTLVLDGGLNLGM